LHKNAFGGQSLPGPAGELYHSARPPADIRGRGGREGEERVENREGRNGGREGREEVGRDGKGKAGRVRGRRKQKGRVGRERGYLSRGPEFLVTPLSRCS